MRVRLRRDLAATQVAPTAVTDSDVVNAERRTNGCALLECPALLVSPLALQPGLAWRSAVCAPLAVAKVLPVLLAAAPLASALGLELGATSR